MGGGGGGGGGGALKHLEYSCFDSCEVELNIALHFRGILEALAHSDKACFVLFCLYSVTYVSKTNQPITRWNILALQCRWLGEL